ncbi:MAG: isochorismatase family cysteine hydrolase [Granulosicoccus sp.]
MILTREIPLQLNEAAMLFIDVQNFSAHRQGAEFKHLDPATFEEKYGWYFNELENRVIPNMQSLLHACRKASIEVLHTTIESLTLDGRDRSLDYKITGFNIPKGSWDGKVINELAPLDDEIWLPKGSSSVFISTHIDYLLRNLGIKQIVISGLITDQCVESAIRDACDLGYLVTQVTDACLTYSKIRHDHSIKTIKGYCRQVNTMELISEISKQSNVI